MVLDSLDNRIDIGRLVLEEPKLEKTDLLFDPERDITETGWGALTGLFRFLITHQYPTPNLGVKPEQMAAFKLLSPKRFAALDGIDRAEGDIIHNARNTDSVIFETSGMNATILFPGCEALKQATRWHWAIFKSNLDLFRPHPYRTGFIDLAVAMKIMYPNAQPELGLNEKTWREIAPFIDSFQGRDELGTKAHLRILFPNKGSELQPTKETREKFKIDLDSLNRNCLPFPGSLLIDAANMKILAAEDVQVTDQGLEITMVKPKPTYTEVVPPFPEVRKF